MYIRDNKNGNGVSVVVTRMGGYEYRAEAYGKLAKEFKSGNFTRTTYIADYKYDKYSKLMKLYFNDESQMEEE
jgi:hypothetical protein